MDIAHVHELFFYQNLISCVMVKPITLEIVTVFSVEIKAVNLQIIHQ